MAKYNGTHEAPKKLLIRRFYNEFDNADEAAHLLFSKLEVKQTVYVLKSTYGHFPNKQEQFRVQLMTEGVRPDSMAIVSTIMN